MVQQLLNNSNCLLTYKKKRKFLLLSLFLFIENLNGIETYKYNFLEQKNTYYSKGFIDARSTNLTFNFFEKDWDKIPAHDRENEAFGEIYFDLHYNFDKLKVGIFKEKNAYMNFNDGFVQTWFHANKNFNELLKKHSITNSLDKTLIKGEANYYSSHGIYFQSVHSFNKSNHLSAKIKLHKATDLHHIKLNGYNSNKFEMEIDYYYVDRNIITKNRFHNKDHLGKGYGIDIEYIYLDDIKYFYFGLLNLNSFIYWDSANFMHYDFNSEIIYLGKDGYNHTRPFGTGYYDFSKKFKQKIPMYYKSSFEYKFLNQYSSGVNTIGVEKTYFNELFIKKAVNKNIYKLGYIENNKNLVFGIFLKDVTIFNFKFENINLEISNQFGYDNTVLTASYSIKF